MAIEIERKFLVSGFDWRTSNPAHIRQGYLNRDKQRTVRVRVADDDAFLTVKGISTGASRLEFEYSIPVDDANVLLGMCDGPLVEKLRHKISIHGLTWEVDEFLGENHGLIVAEVELQNEDQVFVRPAWLALEVTTDVRYFNSSLATNPYTRWG